MTFDELTTEARERFAAWQEHNRGASGDDACDAANAATMTLDIHAATLPVLMQHPAVVEILPEAWNPMEPAYVVGRRAVEMAIAERLIAR